MNPFEKFIQWLLEHLSDIAFMWIVLAFAEMTPKERKTVIKKLKNIPKHLACTFWQELCFTGQLLAKTGKSLSLIYPGMCSAKFQAEHPKWKKFADIFWQICLLPVVAFHFVIILGLYVMATLADSPGGCIACSIIILADFVFLMRLTWPKKRPALS